MKCEFNFNELEIILHGLGSLPKGFYADISHTSNGIVPLVKVEDVIIKVIDYMIGRK